ncbi:MAG: YggS family pyridoxal phosphate-dependent enzyme [Clostridiales bacterium]|nr:YggS family pyridoxal phosphate-dependent enzyme [Clostridiales bacterium]HBM79822.1 YggS family pyridoxal phosphate-dependent enzyme [Clostridiaceae bacterium]
MTIKENIDTILEKVNRACEKSNRSSNEIKLIAVTKTVDINRILEALKCNIKSIGENKVQEMTEKYRHIGNMAEWHMIGHLQTNKVKHIIDKVSMIQSVDSLKLMNEINKRCKDIDKVIDILIEINIGRESTKYGIDPSDILNFIKEAPKYENIRVKGLMTVAPALANKEEVRPYFKEMKKIFDELKDLSIKNVEMKYLSMGMTGDFEIAVEEGSNMIRIGTGIFGPRDYSKK